MLQEYERDGIIRHLGYPITGLPQTSVNGGSLAYGNAGYVANNAYGELFYRLDRMSPGQESALTGRCYGAITFSGLRPNAGDVVQATITSSVLPGGSLSAQATMGSGWSLQQAAEAIATAFAAQPAFNAAGFHTCADYGIGPMSLRVVPQPIASFIAPPNVTLVLTAIGSGTTWPQVTAPGINVPPYLPLRFAGTINKLWGYLPILDYMEGAYGSSVQNQALLKAEETEFRANELEKRDEQYQIYRQKLSNFLGVPLWEDQASYSPRYISRGSM